MALARQEADAAFLRVQFQHGLAEQVLSQNQGSGQSIALGQGTEGQDGGAQGLDPQGPDRDVQSHATPHLGAAADAIGDQRDVEGLGQAEALEQTAIDDGILGT